MNRKTIINRPLDVFRKAMLFLLLCVLIASCSKEDVITEETGITGTPHFTWDIAVELEQPNNWCMTLATEKVAITTKYQHNLVFHRSMCFILGNFMIF